MQVSWIDADRLKALVEQIAPHDDRAATSSPVVEIETAPAEAFTAETAHGFASFSADDDLADERGENESEISHSSELQTEHDHLPAIEEEQSASDDEAGHDSHAHALHNPAAALPLSRIRDKLRAIRQRATEAGILTRTLEPSLKTEAPVESANTVLNGQSADARPKMADVSSPLAETTSASMSGPQSFPSFEIPRGPQNARLAAFAGWARDVLKENGGHVLVMSDDGEVLWGGEAKAGLVLSTMMAWGAATRAGASAACSPPPVMRQPLASGHVLTVIPCETSSGVVHAAVAAPEGLAEEVAQILRGALCAAMSAA